jgi:hypothetical protein
MAREFRTISVSASMVGSKSAQVLSRLARVSSIMRDSVRMARAAASITRSEKYHWQLPARDLLLKNDRMLGAALLHARIVRDRSGSGFDGAVGSNQTGNGTRTKRDGSGWNRAKAVVNAVSRIPELSRAMNALARIERSAELGNAGEATSGARIHAMPMLVSSTEARSRASGRIETRQPAFADAGVLANVRVAPSIRGMMPPPGVSQREFARPPSEIGVSNDGSGRAAITINSSPTVVINGPAGGAVQHDVIGALQAHREELFDQLKRESARRERAQF